jgi:hypothetical protein
MPTLETVLEAHAWRWRQAQRLAREAYDEWREHPGRATYAEYRVAQDVADQAQDALAWRFQSRSRSTSAGASARLRTEILR